MLSLPLLLPLIGCIAPPQGGQQLLGVVLMLLMCASLALRSKVEDHYCRGQS